MGADRRLPTTWLLVLQPNLQPLYDARAACHAWTGTARITGLRDNAMTIVASSKKLHNSPIIANMSLFASVPTAAYVPGSRSRTRPGNRAILARRIMVRSRVLQFCSQPRTLSDAAVNAANRAPR